MDPKGDASPEIRRSDGCAGEPLCMATQKFLAYHCSSRVRGVQSASGSSSSEARRTASSP
jgi:hypothetical protein